MLWSDDYRIGNDMVDSEHMEIFNRLNRLLRAKTDDEVKEMAVFMVNYVSEHFSDEEALMREINYPYYKSHLELHIEFRNVVVEKMAAVDTAEDIQAFKVELHKLVFGWLLHHILVHDMLIGRYQREHQ